MMPMNGDAGSVARQPFPTPLQSSTRQYSPERDAWLDILRMAGLTNVQAEALISRAQAGGVPLLEEALARGVVAEENLYRALARRLGLRFAESIDHDELILQDRDLDMLLRQPMDTSLRVKLEERSGATIFLWAPMALDPAAAGKRIDASPVLAARIRIVTPRALREALISRARPRLLRRARETLFHRFPGFSARIVANAWQGCLLGLIAAGLPVALLAAHFPSELLLHLFFSLFFLGCVGLRFAAIAGSRPAMIAGLKRFSPEDLPIYSVLVALYREAEIVPDLFMALGRLVWPRGKLEIKLVCEEDDAETVAAIEAHGLRPFVEIIRVPAGSPRTKPKALAFALPLTSGELVALYDAEDRPHPFQLLEAWQKFNESDPEVACVQAPLVISNSRRGKVAAMFAFEYAALFRGLLPFLARHRLVLPLGGTSNHFRREALEEVGGWDPYNVTEDADLGLRLARFGYRADLITRPTFEDGPERLATWLPQRTRWFKGWVQTWLVHMRSPLALWRDLGPTSFLTCQILFAGMVLSAIAHPIFLLTMAYDLSVIAAGSALNLWQSALFSLDCANILLGYLSFLVLGWQTLNPRERQSLWLIAPLIPFYWMLMSVAAFRAIWKLYSAPHQWEKTPHYRRAGAIGPVRKAAAPADGVPQGSRSIGETI